jgi:hypothetical protein
MKATLLSIGLLDPCDFSSGPATRQNGIARQDDGCRLLFRPSRTNPLCRMNSVSHLRRTAAERCCFFQRSALLSLCVLGSASGVEGASAPEEQPPVVVFRHIEPARRYHVYVNAAEAGTWRGEDLEKGIPLSLDKERSNTTPRL